MDLQKIIGENIKAIREGKKLTLDAAAQQTGVSRSMLAQIEKGEVNPTISVLWKVANGYRVSFTSLMEDRRAGQAVVIRGAEAAPLAEDGGRYLNYPVFPFREDRLFETYRIQIEPGGSLDAQPHMPGTEEYITVFSGRAEIRAGEETFLLEEGDSLQFRADTAHRYRNTGEGTVWLHMIICYGGR